MQSESIFIAKSELICKTQIRGSFVQLNQGYFVESLQLNQRSPSAIRGCFVESLQLNQRSTSAIRGCFEGSLQLNQR